MRLCTIKSRRLQNRQKSIQDDTEIPIKIFFHSTHLYFLPSNPTILKAFPEKFSTKMKPSNCAPSKRKKEARKVKAKRWHWLLCHFETKKLSWNFTFWACLNFGNWYFVSGIEGLQNHSLYMQNVFLVSFRQWPENGWTFF